ncbi:hypothetical protein JNB71_20710 [Rhizobium herbae]|uniref:Uncharacterized protein n=1 Tax=Rhizobium herbae TaxID=508661 RepID=A0ABS7HG28_9HYPH|nr:hypothetical protein [Rhizobium herbae]MBW9065730.1 hypothetical protein [Rhizobium herbae]
MIPIACLFKDLYNDRWGNPRYPNPGDARACAGPPRLRARRPSAWSLTIPIDRRLR